jgi:hypothetical protein
MDPAKSDPIRLMYLCDRLNAYERYLWRDRTLRSIGSFPVAVMGTDWHQMRNPPPGLRILPEPYPTGAEAWCSTALSLNVLPGNRQGCHDRLLGALAHGTAVITDRNQWTDRYITDGVDGWTFDRRDPQLASRLAEITADRDRLAAVAAAGQSGIGRHSDNRRFLGQVLDLVRSWRTRMWLRGR